MSPERVVENLNKHISRCRLR